MSILPKQGIYVITDGCSDRLIERIELALAGGAAMVQYRDLTNDTSRRRDEAHALASLCAQHGAPLIIDHDIALAKAVAAAGIHMSQADGDPAAARAELGREAIIGVSCYASAALAHAAAKAGASYVSFGAFFPSPTKPDAGRAPLELLLDTATLGVPRVAIGGITPENGGVLVDAGADFLATVSTVLAAPDVRQAARRMADLYSC